MRALTPVATVDNEEALLEMAGPGTAAHLERIMPAYRAVLGSEQSDQANHLHQQRFLAVELRRRRQRRGAGPPLPPGRCGGGQGLQLAMAVDESSGGKRIHR